MSRDYWEEAAVEPLSTLLRHPRLLTETTLRKLYTQPHNQMQKQGCGQHVYFLACVGAYMFIITLFFPPSPFHIEYCGSGYLYRLVHK